MIELLGFVGNLRLLESVQIHFAQSLNRHRHAAIKPPQAFVFLGIEANQCMASALGFNSRNSTRGLHEMDPVDLRIVAVLQEDASIESQELVRQVHLSPAP